MTSRIFFNKIVLSILSGIIIIECLSLLGHVYGFLNTAIFLLLVIGTFILSLRKLEYGFWIAATELFIGSFGYLFFYDLGNFRISVRLGIFTAVWLAWLIQAIRQKQFAFWSSPYRTFFGIFILTVCLGIIIAFLNGVPIKNIFFDSNAYLYFGFLFVALHVINSWSRVVTLGQILVASVFSTTLKTISLLFFFSHATDPWIIRTIYTWVRDTRVGEIAQVTGMYYRIFFQSHIWSLFVLVGCVIWLMLTNKKDEISKIRRWVWFLTLCTSLTLLISFSRSIWLSLAMTFLLIFCYVKVKQKITWRQFGVTISGLAISALLAVGLISLIVSVRLPGGTGSGVSAVSLISERLTTTDEAAIGSRYELLKPLIRKYMEKPVFGSGFGTTVSYRTLDPRTKTANGGMYTTYAFEWGFLDILVKTGLIGLVAYLFLIWKIFKTGNSSLSKISDTSYRLTVISILFCIISLLIVHMTTPYLNHPLGIFLLICAAAIFLVKPAQA